MTHKFFFVCALLMFTSVHTRAALVVQHYGATDPTTEGFAAAGAFVTAAPETNDLGQGIGAWEVDTRGIAGLGYYGLDLTTDQVADATAYGWKLSVRLRVIDVPDGWARANCFWAYRTGGSRSYQIHMDDPGASDQILALLLGSGTQLHTISDGAGAYHLLELVATGGYTASFWLDGADTGLTTTGRTGWGGRWLWFGDAASNNEGHHAMYNLVMFQILTSEQDEFLAAPPLPEPATLCLLGIGGLVVRRKRPAHRSS